LIQIDITVQPVSINTTLNSTVVFSCEAVAGELTVRVEFSDNNTHLGQLASVVDLDYNGSSVLLTWTAPYTLDNVPITPYSILLILILVH
uniref:Fibronectin type-III domain-containing protein n=1 Tax=Amphimedon queenslandica TaxID=400682 RepID=A0A1X7U4T7_AMPQE